MNTTMILRSLKTLVLLLIASVVLLTFASPSSAVTRAEAIAIVRSIINRNATACRISKTKSITAVASSRNWRVTARIVMSASGIARNETAVWTVRSDGEATPANQLTAELAHGCP